MTAVGLTRSRSSSEAALWADRAGADDAPPASFVVELTHFSGPLDLLLTLLREEEIDIYDIPIARIAEQFLARVRSLRLDEAADYLEMAARLLRIKAQMLLPRREGEDGWEDPRAELVRHLLEYQQVREVVDVLEHRAEGRRNRFARTPASPNARASDATDSATAFVAVLADLMAAVDRVLRIARGPDIHAVVPRALNVAAALELVRTSLAQRLRIRWRDLVSPTAEPWEVLSVLLAILELARLGECALSQRAPFGPLDIASAEQDPASLYAGESSGAHIPALPSLSTSGANDSAGAAA